MQPPLASHVGALERTTHMLADRNANRHSIAHPNAVRATIPQKRSDGNVSLGELNVKI